MAPLHVLEDGAESSDLCGYYGNEFCAKAASVMARALATVPKWVTDNLGGGCVSRGWRRTTIAPNRHGVHRSATAQGAQACSLVLFLGKPLIQPDAAFPALDGRGSKALLCLPCEVPADGVTLIP